MRLRGEDHTSWGKAAHPGVLGFRVRIEKEVVGTINGGGPEFRFKTYNGDIYVRKGSS